MTWINVPYGGYFDSGPSSGSIWLADLGLYRAPTSTDPVGPAALPGGAVEIDYYVGDVGTADYTNVAWAPPALLYDTWRYLDSSTIYTGHNSQPHGTGSHILVVVWQPPGITTAPTMDPLTLVPGYYATGATGDTGGHWSDWQDFGDTAVTITPNMGDLLANEVIDSSPPGDVDLDPTIATVEADTRAGTPRIGPTTLLARSLGATGAFSYSKQFGSTRTSGDTAQGLATLDSSPYATPPALPPLLAGMTPGVDYAAIPESAGVYVQYETDGGTFVGWEDWALTVTANYQLEANRDTGSGTTTSFSATPPDAPFRYRLIDPVSFTSGVTETPAWPAYGDGTEIATYSIAFGADTVHTYTDTVTLPLSTAVGATRETFSLLVQSDLLGPVDVPSLNQTITSGEVLSVSYVLRILSHYLDFPGSTGDAYPQATYNYPRFRYWIPDTTGIHTVGGHWASAGGAEIRMLQGDGTTWLPIVDGPDV